MVTSKKWRCRLPLNFFGLSDEYIEGVYEEIFQLKHFGGWSFIEAYSLPIVLRRWFLERLAKQFEKEKEQMDKATKKGRR